MDPTVLIRTAYGTITYADLQASARRVRAHRTPSAVIACRSTVETLELIGNRARLKFTTAMRYRPGISHDEMWRNEAILSWKDGDWRLWRLTQTNGSPSQRP